MLCRDVLKDVRRLGPDGLPEAARRHLAACAGCAAEARAAALLRLGSGVALDASARPGLADRVRARLAADEAADGAAAVGAAGRRMDASAWQAWSEAFDRIFRPALACAATLALIAVVLFARSASAPAGTELAALAEDDSMYEALP